MIGFRRPAVGGRHAVRISFAFLISLAVCACAPPRMKLPAGPGAPATDGADVVARATTACRDVHTLTAEIAVSGRVAGQKVRGHMSAGVAAPASARIEAVAPFGAPMFIFVATGDDATLLLPRDGRVLEHGSADAVLEAVSGVPLGPAALRDVLTGCPIQQPSATEAREAGADWRIVPAGTDTLFISRARGSDPWRIAAVVHGGDRPDGWRAEYRDYQSDLPRGIRLVSTGGRFDLNLALSQVDLNVPLGAEAFRVNIPRGAEPISLEELRRNGPLAERKSDK